MCYLDQAEKKNIYYLRSGYPWNLIRGFLNYSRILNKNAWKPQGETDH